MNDRDQRRYDRLPRVQTFGRENSVDFAAGGKAKAHFANLDQHIRDLDDAKAGQTPARAAWESASRVERAPQREKKPATPSSTISSASKQTVP